MRRRDLLRGLVVVAALAIAPSVHADPLDEVTRQLRAQGFQVHEVSRTWLGRIRVIAESDTQQREIVLDRTTGEIRRDLVTSRRPSHPAESDNRDDGSSGQSAGGSSGSGGGDDDDRDDDSSGSGGGDDDDRDDDDSSGRGGGDDDDRDDDDSSGRGGGDDDDRDDDDSSGRGGGDDDGGDDDDDDD